MLDFDKIVTRLREGIPEASHATGVKAISAGHSNQTYLLEGTDLVLRLGAAEAPLFPHNSISKQAEVMCALQEIENFPPTPAVVFIDQGDQILGESFYLMRRIDGIPYPDYAPPQWILESPMSFREEFMGNFVEALAKISCAAPIVELGPVLTPLDHLRIWKNYAELADHVQLVSLIDEIAGTTPKSSGLPSIVHGDTKLGNTMWHGSKLAALFDWELAFNGDPIEDLAYTLWFVKGPLHPALQSFDVEGFWDRDRFVAGWEERAGRTAVDICWYEASAVAKCSAILAYGDYLYRSGQSSDDRISKLGGLLTQCLPLLRKMIDAI